MKDRQLDDTSSSVDPSDDAADASADMAMVEDALSGMSGESMAADDALRHIITKVTDEGLIIELFDLPGDPLFVGQSEVPTAIMVDMSQMISRVLELLRNDIAVNGFTQAQPVVLLDNPVWRVSTLRANQVRLLLQSGGTEPMRITRVSGHADRKPVARNPMSVRNNRIEIVLLRVDKND